MSAARALRATAALLFAGAALGLAWLLFVWPPPVWYRSHFPAKTAFMRMRDRQARGTKDAPPRQYQPVALAAMSEWLPQAATAGEDEAFFEHQGIDWRSLRQALGYRRETFAWSSARDRGELRRAWRTANLDKVRGASTITQQLAKNLYLSPSRNPLRKVKEAVIAWRLEWALSKDRILELYLNTAELGRNVWGVEAASQEYFGRSATSITREQAALLIATLPHPRTSNPAHRPGRAQWRQRLILRKLRGEDVEVPQEVDETEVARPPAESLPPVPDSVPLPVDTTRPRDSVPAPLPVDTARIPRDTVKRDTTRRDSTKAPG